MNGLENNLQQKSKPAQDSTQDLIKLLISLASGVIAISIAFIEKLSNEVGIIIAILYLGWIALIASIFFGVKALSKLVHAQQTDANNWYETTLPPMRKCWLFFQIGVGLLVVYASIASGIRALRPDEENNHQIILEFDTSSHKQLMLIDISKIISDTCKQYLPPRQHIFISPSTNSK